MNKEELELIQNTIDYHFDNDDLLQQAFTRRSYTEENGSENNEVLEFIGDKALDIVVMKVLMKRFGHITDGDYQEFKTKYDEGKFTEIKKELVERKMLSKCIDNIGFNQYLIMGKGDKKKNVQEEESVKEDLFEAIVGAVAIDSDWDFNAIEEVVKMMLDFNAFFNKKENEVEYVQEVQEWSQKNHSELPNYSFYETYDGYNCTLYLPGINYRFDSNAKSKAGARFLAAKEAYEYLDYNDLLYNMEDEVGEPDYERAINQLQELYQKGFINKPEYVFEEEQDYNGNSIWVCTCYINGIDEEFTNESSSKKESKKDSAYDMICYLLEESNPNEEDNYYEEDEWDD